jgi:hypothetical protein
VGYGLGDGEGLYRNLPYVAVKGLRSNSRRRQTGAGKKASKR